MRELYVDSRGTEDETGRKRRFDYYILIGEVDTGQFFCESYGIKITQPEEDAACAIPNITTSAARIDSLLELAMANVVTPVSLSDVVADWL